MPVDLRAMKEAEEQPSATWWKAPARQWATTRSTKPSNRFF